MMESNNQYGKHLIEVIVEEKEGDGLMNSRAEEHN